MIKKIEEFVKKVDSMKKEMLGDDCGFVLLAYQEIDDKQQHNTFAAGGKLSNMAECFVAFMKSEPVMANVVMAASSAIAQQRIVEAQMLAEAKKPKKTRKKKAN